MRARFWIVGGSRSTRRELTYTWGEHANSTQKGPIWDSDQESSCCEVTVLTTTPLCSPRSISRWIIFGQKRSVFPEKFDAVLEKICKVISFTKFSKLIGQEHCNECFSTSNLTKDKPLYIRHTDAQSLLFKPQDNT